MRSSTAPSRAVRSDPARHPVAGRKALRAALSALTAAAAAALLLAACIGSEDDLPPRPLGPGSGAGPVGATTAFPIRAPDGGTIGTLDYDNLYFDMVTEEFPTADDTRAGLLFRTTDLVSIQLAIIYGRPDTPCRFHAALLARDEMFTILGDGENRLSDQGLVFHEVVLVKGSAHSRLDCARLTDSLGVEVLASAPIDLLGTEQVHFVLNSIRP